MSRKKLTLSVEEELTQRMKLQAIRENRDVSTITEELYARYLNAAERKPAKAAARKLGSKRKLSERG
jgi:hypothetical protein